MMFLLAASCAKREAENSNALEQEALDAWMEKRIAEGKASGIRQSNGVWVDVIDAGTGDVSGVDTITWMKLDYTSTDINGNVFSTRDSLEALKQRTFSPHTNYVPDYVYCSSANSALSKGLLWALTNEVGTDAGKVKLRAGAQVRLYIPSYLAYGSGTYTDDQGYGGQYPLGSNKILVEDLKIREIIKNPLTHEEDEVEKFATNVWGVGKTDTLAPGLFVDSVRFQGYPELFENHPYEPWDRLTVDSTATVWYVGRFMPTEGYPDGFIFDTNIKSIYNKFYGRRAQENYPAQTGTFTALSYTAKNDQKSYIGAWYRAIPKLRRGLWYRFILPSSYGYSGTGMSKAIKNQQDYYNYMLSQYAYSSMYNSYGSSYGGYGSNYYGNYYNTSNPYYQSTDKSVMTEIQPYTPLIFEVYIVPYKTEE